MAKLYIFEAFYDGDELTDHPSHQIVIATNWRTAVELALSVKPDDKTDLTRLDRNGFVDAIEETPKTQGPYR